MSSSTIQEQNNQKSKFRFFARILWGLAILLIIGSIGFFMVIANGDLPDFKELENPDFELATTIYDNKGREFGRYYTQNRVPAKFEDLNPDLIKALVATEDARYYDHAGIDFKALGRVAFGVLTLNGSKGGGSTITQQLAKLLYDRPNFGNMNKLQRAWTLGLTKFKEWITAVKLEKSYTKEEILAMYLNKFSFLYGAYGIRAASEVYFGKQQQDLKTEEAATLVGMLKNPALFNPIRRPDTVVFRRMIVLNQMRKEGYISQSAYDSLKVLPLDMSSFKRDSHAEGPAPYFRAELAKWLRLLFEKEEYRKSDGSKYNIYRDGLKIYTTIDLNMQMLAEEVMLEHMATVQDRYWRVWRNRDPWTHDADEFQRGIRQNGLKNLIRFSDRYKSMRESYLGEAMDKIATAKGMTLSDWDVENLFAEDEKKGTIARLVAKKTISAERAKKYRSILNSNHWPVLKNKHVEFQIAVDEEFNKPVKMKVFAYNDDMEVDTIMTPMDSLKYHRKFLQTGILAIDPNSGQVKTWVGGINHKYFQFDHVQSSRQVGSTFKPFVYATAIALQGISPCFPVKDEPYTIAPGDGSFGLLEPWTPQNSDGEYTGETFTLYEGLQKSKNTVSVFLMQQLGNANVVRGLIDNMGIDSSLMRSDGQFRVPNVPSICLGSADLNVMEMTGAYTTFANNGVFSSPYFVSSIEDENGRVLYRAVPEERVALPPKANYVMIDMLKYAATGFAHNKSEVGGKTGTTNDYVDGWFIGVTPSLVVGTWVGGEDPWIRFLSLANGQGSRMAKPFFRTFLDELEKRDDVDFDPNARFNIPPGGMDIEIDCEKYKGMQDTPDYDHFQEQDEFQDEFIEDINRN
jgi:penicillin-binding protein 1A